MCEAEANLSALIESTDDLIGSFDLEYKLLTFNKALQASIKSSIGVQATVPKVAPRVKKAAAKPKVQESVTPVQAAVEPAPTEATA
jgi:hypothetical protein